MAKKEFTDITIKICQRKCNFKRVTNETLTKFAEKAEKEPARWAGSFFVFRGAVSGRT